MDEIERRAEALEEGRDVPLTDLLSDAFLQQHTDFETAQALFDAAGYPAGADIDASELDAEPFSKFIAQHSRLGGVAPVRGDR